MRRIKARHLAAAMAVALGLSALAVDLPHTFAPGETISASEMNENFAALNDAKQQRVHGECAVGSAVRAIREDGSVECEPRMAFHAESTGGPADLAQAPAYTTVLAVSVPSGSYVVHAKVVVVDSEGADAFDATVRCTLFAGAEILDSYALVLGSVGRGTVFTLQGVTTTNFAQTQLDVACRKGSEDTTVVRVAESPRLTAMQVSSIE